MYVSITRNNQSISGLYYHRSPQISTELTAPRESNWIVSAQMIAVCGLGSPAVIFWSFDSVVYLVKCPCTCILFPSSRPRPLRQAFILPFIGQHTPIQPHTFSLHRQPTTFDAYLSYFYTVMDIHSHSSMLWSSIIYLEIITLYKSIPF